VKANFGNTTEILSQNNDNKKKKKKRKKILYEWAMTVILATQENRDFKPVGANSSRDLLSKKPIMIKS
jgi:hypothetical protein